MNAISNLYIKHLAIKGYTDAHKAADEVCARTQVNDPERNEALMHAAWWGVTIDAYSLQKAVGITYFNVWD